MRISKEFGNSEEYPPVNVSLSHFIRALFTDADMRILIRVPYNVFQIIRFLSRYGYADLDPDANT